MMKNLKYLFIVLVFVQCFFTVNVNGQSTDAEWSSSEIEEYFKQLSTTSNDASLKSSSLKAETVISALEDSYCSDYGDVEIVPDNWELDVSTITWTIKTFVGSEGEVDHSDWGTISGTGSSTVFTFDTELVTSGYYGNKIYFYYEQFDSSGNSLQDGYDYSYVYLTPTAYSFLPTDAEICYGESTTIVLQGSESGMSYQLEDASGTPEGVSYDGDGGMITLSVSPELTTEYYISAKNSSDGSCTTYMSNSVTITVNDLPTSSASNNGPICEGDIIELYEDSGESYSSYSWSGPDSFTSSDQDPTIASGTSDNVGTYTVTVEDSNGCTNSASTVVVISSAPTPIISGNTDVCLNAIEIYTTESGMSNYSWSVTGGTINSGSGTESVNVDWTSIGTQTVSVSYTDTDGCSSIVNTDYSVTVNDLPTPSLSGDTEVCFNETGVVYTTDSGMSNYTWTVAGGSITSGSSTYEIAVTWDTSGTGTVTVNYDNVNGCSADNPTSLDVVVNDLPVPVVSGSTDVCLNSTETYSTDSGVSNYSWTVIGGTIDSGDGTESIDVTWDTSGSQTVSVTYTDTNGCDAEPDTDYVVIVNELPTPVISGSTNVCLNSTETYTTDSSMSNYSWTVIGGTIDSGDGTSSVDITWDTSGIQTVSVTYTDTNGCDAAVAAAYTVTVNILPVPILSGSSNVCLNSTETYTTDSGMSNYIWTVTGGTITSGDGTYSVGVVWNTTGAQAISVNYDNLNACTASSPTMLSVNVNSLPTPVIIGNTEACIDVSSYTYSTDSGNDNYVWTINGGTIDSGTGTESVSVTWDTVGDQTISVNYEDPSTGCTASASTEFTVDVIEIYSNISVSSPSTGSTTICAGTDVTFNASVSGGSGDCSYEFHIVSEGVDSSVQSGSTLTYTTSGLIDGDEIYVIITDNVYGCSGTSFSITMTVEDNPVPVLSISSSGGNTICLGETVDFVVSPSSYDAYIFYLNGTTELQSGTTNTYSSDTFVDGDVVTVTAYDGDCTGTSSSITLIVNDLPTVALTSDAITICESEIVNFTATGSGTGTLTYQFYVDGVSQQGPSTSNTFSWTSSSDYSVEVTVYDDNNCEETSSSIDVIISQPVAILTADQTEICDGDAVVFTASGGDLYEFFVNSTSVQSGSSDEYISTTLDDGDLVTVQITDSIACTASNSGITVTVNPVPTVSLSSSDSDNVICQNDEVTFTASGTGDLYEFFINDVSVQGAGSEYEYTTTSLADGDEVTVVISYSTSGCSTTSSGITITVNTLPVAILSATSTSFIEGTSITFTASGGTSYEFYVNGIEVQSLSSIDTYTTDTLEDDDVVIVYVYNSNGCMSYSSITVNVYEGLLGYDVYSTTTEYCEGDGGVTIYLADAQYGTTYELIRIVDNVQEGSSITYDGTNTVSWDDILGTYEYKVEAYYASVPSEVLEMNNTITITENASPTIYDISPTGTVTGCNSGAGYTISVENSDLDVTYTLLLEGTGVETFSGTGAQIYFSAQVGVGTYTVSAENDLTGCNSTMDGEFEIQDDGSSTSYTIYVDPILENDSIDGRYCEGNSVEIALDGSTLNVVYKLFLDGTETGTEVTGTGSAVSFGYVTDEGTYTCRVESTSGCEYLMDGYVVVEEVALPTAFTVEVDNEGHYCDGDVGVYISVGDQEEDVMYILYLDGTTVIDTVIGSNLSGSSLEFADPITVEGTYYVEAEVSDVGCSTSMSNTIEVTMDALPEAYDLTADPGYFCTGSTTTITLSDSEANVDYTLYLIGTTVNTSVDVISGTGASIDFEEVDTEGFYYIESMRTDGITGCSNVMNDTVSITEITDFPSDVSFYTIDYGSGCDNGDSLVVETEEFITYDLYKVTDYGTNYATYYAVDIDNLSGDGTSTGFERIVDSDYAVYSVLAYNAYGCSIYLSDTVMINVPDALVKQVVSGNGDICNGDSGLEIGLESTEEDVVYYLWKDGDTTATDTITGDGGVMYFDELSEEGEYYVVAESSDGSCLLDMANSVTLTVHDLPIAYAMTGSGLSCDLANDGAVIGLEQTEVDVNYTFQYDDGTGILDNLDPTITGDGGVIEMTVYEEGTYTVIAETEFGCTSSMNSSIYVEEGYAPTDYNVFTDDYSYCDSDNGIELFLANNEIDVFYYVINNVTNDTVAVEGVNTDTSVADTLSLGVYTEGSYEIVGVLGGDACQTSMNSGYTITITLYDSPDTSFDVMVEDVTICSSDTAVIYIESSEVGREYRLEEDGIAINDTIQSVSGEQITWYVTDGVSGTSSIYEVIAMAGGTCDAYLDPTVEISYSDGPDDFTLTPSDTIYCEGSDSIYISVNPTQLDVAYLLVETVDASTAIDVLIGNDEEQTYTSAVGQGSYTVRAILYTTGCEDMADDTITITKSALPEIVADTYCDYVDNMECAVGDSVCIDPTEVDVDYYLYDSEGVLQELISGDGSMVCFDAIEDIGSYTILAKSSVGAECENYFDGSFEYDYSSYGLLVAVDDIFNVSSSLSYDTCIVRSEDSLIYIYNGDEYVVPYDGLYDDGYFDTSSDDVTVIDKYYGDYVDSDENSNIEFHLLEDGISTTTIVNDTVGSFVIDVDYGILTYTKTPGFYGKYTLYYMIKNTDYESRQDTGMISLYVGNESVDDETSFLIPNAFSPNDDGKNDSYVISTENSGITTTSSSLEVFNRWGTLVYLSDGNTYGEGNDWWDGTSSTSNMVSIGEDLPSGTYFFIYKVKINDEGTIKSKEYNGYVELRR